MNDRKTTSEARSENSAERLALAQPKLLRAILEHRRESRSKLKTSFFDFREQHDQSGSERLVRTDDLCDGTE